MGVQLRIRSKYRYYVLGQRKLSLGACPTVSYKKQVFRNWRTAVNYSTTQKQTVPMDLFKEGMKGPSRPAPSVPALGVNRYSPVTNWDNDPFGADVFEPTPHVQKKKPPPRPPPPRVNIQQPDVPAKPSHFIRRPTVLSSLLSRKNKTPVTQNVQNQIVLPDFNEVDSTKMFPKCEPKNVQMGALIDLSSPPSSPTFTTRSSSDGLSVDSFGSDATTSTNHHNHLNGNASQAESGFEDDFDLFLNSRKIAKDDTIDNFSSVDPFSPPLSSNKPPIMKKPEIKRDWYDTSSNMQLQAPSIKGPTIIRAKPARPKPPDNSSLLKTTFGSTFPITSMNLNTTTPIQKINGGFGDGFDKPFSWDDSRSSPEREPSPPMPSIPPPPPPLADDDPEPLDSADWSDGHLPIDDDEPYAIALFDYFTDHPDDLCFSTNTKIKLVRRVDDEWLYGSLRSGAQGLFPSNYVEIKVPLHDEKILTPSPLGVAIALYDFEPDQPGDLRFITGDTITIKYKLNDEWYYGECNGVKGQFPKNYVKMS